MATTTPNYGWSVPTSTDLVKDGATAIETLGDSADATVKALNPETTLGDIAYRSATANTNTRLAIGTTGQVLSVTGGVPAWATPAAGGGMTLINTGGTALSGASVTISSIPSTYKQLFVVVQAVRNTTAGSSANIRFNSDTSSKYASRGYSNTDANPSYASQVQMYNNLNNASPFNTVAFTVSNYTDTGYKIGFINSGGDSSGFPGTNVWMNAQNFLYWGSSAISSITFLTPDTFSGGTVYIYGVN